MKRLRTTRTHTDLQWYRLSTTLFRLLFNSFELEQAKNVGRHVLSLGFNLVENMVKTTYYPVAYGLLYHDRPDTDHTVNVN